MITLEGPRLVTSYDQITRWPTRTRLIGVMHALSDTREFISHVLATGNSVERIFAKPFSGNPDVVQNLNNQGAPTVQLGSYATIEGTSTLRDTLAHARDHQDGAISVIDVGGYFARPLVNITEKEPELLPKGVVEVTTFGHNRYLEKVADIGSPIVSVARSPLKDVEAVFVGESTWLGLDQVLRAAGLSAFGKKIGVVGYGMIGRRVAQAALAGGGHTRVFDHDPIKRLDARSYRHQSASSLAELLAETDIVLASTGGLSIPFQDILNYAKDGLILGSAGSRTQEIDVTQLQAHASSIEVVCPNLTRYTLNNKCVYILRNGSSINFLVGSCPDETMDIVFAEIAASLGMILEGSLRPGSIHEVNQETRQAIASAWLKTRE